MWLTAGRGMLHLMHAVAAFVWLLTPFASGAPVAYCDRFLAAVARRLRRSLTAGWHGLAGLEWGTTRLETEAGEVVFVVGGPLGGFCVWSCGSRDDNGPGNDRPPDGDGGPPEWDWERFERDLSDYVAKRAASRT